MRTCSVSFVFVLMALLYISCGNPEAEREAARFDSLKNAPKETTFKNKDIIQAPDSDYTGDYIDRYDNGVIKFRGDFRFGKRHGQWLAFYLNGEKWSECFYNKGLKDGASNIYFPSGKLQMSGWYKNDMPDSVWVFYDTTGVALQKVRYKDGREVPEKTN